MQEVDLVMRRTQTHPFRDAYSLTHNPHAKKLLASGISWPIGRTYKISEFFVSSYIEKLRLRNESTTPRPGFDLRAYREQTGKYLEDVTELFRIKLCISSRGRFSLKGIYATLHEEADGSISERINVESCEAAISYILALRTEAAVIYPPRLRKAALETALAIEELYKAQA